MCNQINPKWIPGSPRISSPPGPISLKLCFYSIKICYYCSNNHLFSVWKLWDSKYIFYLLVLGCCFLVWDGNLFGILYFSERSGWKLSVDFAPGWEEPARLTNPIQSRKYLVELSPSFLQRHHHEKGHICVDMGGFRPCLMTENPFISQ